MLYAVMCSIHVHQVERGRDIRSVLAVPRIIPRLQWESGGQHLYQWGSVFGLHILQPCRVASWPVQES